MKSLGLEEVFWCDMVRQDTRVASEWAVSLSPFWVVRGGVQSDSTTAP